MGRYRNIDQGPRDLADGRIVPRGGWVELTAAEAKEPHNAALIDEGFLIPADKAAQRVEKAIDATAKTEEGKAS